MIANAEERARQHPSTFEIPEIGKRASRKKGELVKIILELPPGAPPRKATGERPWFIIKEVREGPRYIGALDNEPAVFTEMKLGDLVEFGPEHIIQVWEEKAGK